MSVEVITTLEVGAILGVVIRLSKLATFRLTSAMAHVCLRRTTVPVTRPSERRPVNYRPLMPRNNGV